MDKCQLIAYTNTRIMKTFITDIDNTIADPRKRMKRSLQEINREDVYEKAIGRFGGFREYLDDSELDELWQLFLSDKYLHLDVPEPTSARVLNRFRERGVHIVYLTGRHDGSGDSMRSGTEEWLREHEFPEPNRGAVRLIMKPSRKVDDGKFKLNALKNLLGKFTDVNGRNLYGIGDMPDDARVYSKAGLKPILIDWLGLFPREELLLSAPDVRLVEDWTEVESTLNTIFG